MMAFSFSLRVKLGKPGRPGERASRTSGEQDGVAASGLAALGLPLGAVSTVESPNGSAFVFCVLSRVLGDCLEQLASLE